MLLKRGKNMLKKFMVVMLVLLPSLAVVVAAGRRTTASEKAPEAGDHWQIKGALSEACTCSVPCTCNFGEGPSPHDYCYAVYSYEIREGHFNAVNLDGLRFAGTDTATGGVVYLDAKAQGERRTALEAVARRVMRITNDRMGHHRLLGIK